MPEQERERATGRGRIQPRRAVLVSRVRVACGTRGQTVCPASNPLAQAKSAFAGNIILQYDYVCDAVGSRVEIARSGTMMSESRSDTYGYNARNELVSASKSVGPRSTANEYSYNYDDIGNRLASSGLVAGRDELVSFAYSANSLNQHTSISISNSAASAFSAGEFSPAYDADGNQTLVRTSTGTWSVSYNGENRPVLWTCGDTNITMKFDRMGRRVEYLETVTSDAGGSQSPATATNTHHRFVYDGYLCIQRLNAAADNAIDLIFAWDPAEPVATRPLMFEKPNVCKLHVTHDGNKNVSDLVFFSGVSGVAAHYEYAPFGAITASTRNSTSTVYDFRTYNPFRFSSEYAGDVLSLVCYNYRHYEPAMGRWLSRDPLEEMTYEANFELPDESRSLAETYLFLRNAPCSKVDVRGLFDYLCTCSLVPYPVGEAGYSVQDGQKCSRENLWKRITVRIDGPCITILPGLGCYCQNRKCTLETTFRCIAVKGKKSVYYAWEVLRSSKTGCSKKESQ